MRHTARRQPRGNNHSQKRSVASNQRAIAMAMLTLERPNTHHVAVLGYN